MKPMWRSLKSDNASSSRDRTEWPSRTMSPSGEAKTNSAPVLRAARCIASWRSPWGSQRIGLARALAAEAKYVEAQETYNRIVREGLPPGAPDAFKHALDRVFAFLLLVLLSPVILLTALAVRLSSRGPVLFAQRRIALDDGLETRAFEHDRFGRHRGAYRRRPRCVAE